VKGQAALHGAAEKGERVARPDGKFFSEIVGDEGFAFIARHAAGVQGLGEVETAGLARIRREEVDGIARHRALGAGLARAVGEIDEAAEADPRCPVDCGHLRGQLFDQLAGAGEGEVDRHLSLIFGVGAGHHLEVAGGEVGAHGIGLAHDPLDPGVCQYGEGDAGGDDDDGHEAAMAVVQNALEEKSDHAGFPFKRNGRRMEQLP